MSWVQTSEIGDKQSFDYAPSDELESILKAIYFQFFLSHDIISWHINLETYDMQYRYQVLTFTWDCDCKLNNGIKAATNVESKLNLTYLKFSDQKMKLTPFSKITFSINIVQERGKKTSLQVAKAFEFFDYELYK